MQIIINNPFRNWTLCRCKNCAIKKNFNRLKMFVGADQEIPDELSQAIFPCLGPLKRSKENIDYASAHLNLDQDKMLAALLWFYDGNAITDEPAFDELRESNIQGALNIWKKLVEKEKLLKKLFCFQNISTFICKGHSEDHFQTTDY
ncbi:MAG: hypothetical protein IPO92_18875 [Saprospiraceae bacterium]|nr:hypothetical protein [Saprospiraceae bacterium]